MTNMARKREKVPDMVGRRKKRVVTRMAGRRVVTRVTRTGKDDTEDRPRRYRSALEEIRHELRELWGGPP